MQAVLSWHTSYIGMPDDGTQLVVPSLGSLLPAIFVAAVADDLVEVTRLRKDMLNDFQVFRVQLDAEHLGILFDVFSHPQPSTDDDAGGRTDGPRRIALRPWRYWRCTYRRQP